MSDAEWVSAIHSDSLQSVAPPGSPAALACQRIENRVAGAARELIDLLHANGVSATRSGQPKIYDQFKLTIPETQALRAISVAEEAGYVRWVRLEGGALRCHLKLQKSMMLIRGGENMMRVILGWGKAVRPPRPFRPHMKTLASIDLPSFAWPAYLVVHPLYVLQNRVRGKRHTPEDRPFLGTPPGLLGPLFEAINLTQTDVFVDVGCGDGRVAIEAARCHGCEARGIEYHADVAEQAKQRVTDAGMAGRVAIVQGDATRVDLSDATAIFIFLPVSILRQLLPQLLRQVTPGTRILTHELSPIPADFSPQPTRKIPVFGEDAVTVANLWVA